jgi:sugar/nucleoside kinase (ribokinase family)
LKVNKILCVGAALYDILLRESDEFVASLGNEKGGMTLAEHAQIIEALAQSSETSDSAPGGSACNTAVGLARLGANSHFLGKRGQDATGENMQKELETSGLQCHLRLGEDPTGQVLSVITPDAQRTMMTYLGSAATLSPDEIKLEDFQGYDLVHIEGYLLFNTGFCQKVIELAKAAGCKISLDLSSFEVVNIFKDVLKDMLKNDVDLIIANEDEAKAYTGEDPKASLEVFAPLAELAVVKLGADGVLIAHGEERYEVSGNKVEAVDTTGAGDLWASGFIYGLTQGWSLDQAAKLGNTTGAAVVQVVGAVVPESTWDSIRSEIN